MRIPSRALRARLSDSRERATIYRWWIFNIRNDRAAAGPGGPGGGPPQISPSPVARDTPADPWLPPWLSISFPSIFIRPRCTLPFLSAVFSPRDPFRGSPLPDRAIVIYLRFVDRASISYVSRYEESASLVTRKIEKSRGGSRGWRKESRERGARSSGKMK